MQSDQHEDKEEAMCKEISMKLFTPLQVVVLFLVPACISYCYCARAILFNALQPAHGCV